MHVIGTAGHVDHGKSALVERLTGIDPDRFEEEKRRGLTIDLGFAWLELPSGQEVGIVDVPGHERFIKNMLAGAGGISVCLFVIAANEGWMPQSAEHLAVLDVLNVTSGVAAVTKSDSVDAETLAIAVSEVEEHLAESSLAGAPIVPCSARTGDGIPQLIAALGEVVASTPPAPDLGAPRLWVDRVFTIAGAGTIVTGTLAGGSLAEGEEIEVTPERRRARIRSIQSHKKRVEHIGPGNRVALNLAGLARAGAKRGDAIVRGGQWPATRIVDVQLQVLASEMSGVEHELSEKGAHLFYAGSAETPVRIKLLDASRLSSGEAGFAQLHLRDALPLTRGDRFVLRDAGRVLTFGGGRVLDPLPTLMGRKKAGLLSLLRELVDASPQEALRALVETEGMVTAENALLRVGTREGQPHLGKHIVSPSKLRQLHEILRTALERHHVERPLERGIERERLRAITELEPGAFDALLVTATDVTEDGSTVRLATFSVELSPQEQQQRAAIVQQIESAGFMPPLAANLNAQTPLLRALVHAGELVGIGDFYLTQDQARRARSIVRARIEESGPVTMAEIRDLLATSRKYAVPLGEWLDATGATIRQGDKRMLGPNP